MSVYTQSIEDGKILKPAEDVRKETDYVRKDLRRELGPVARDIIQETIIPKIEKAVNDGQYSCEVNLPNRFDYPNKYRIELDRENMQLAHDLITDYLTGLGYKVFNVYNTRSAITINISWCTIEKHENYSS